jgi:hypothetical protein
LPYFVDVGGFGVAKLSSKQGYRFDFRGWWIGEAG